MGGAGTGTGTTFVGRRRDLADAREALARERLVSLIGPGGVGKTRLATELAHRIETPVLGTVELAADGPTTDLTGAALAACGVRDDPQRAAADRLAAALDRPGVLVLDGCEHVREDVALWLARLLPRCAALTVLVTSRVRLGLPEERVLRLDGLALDSEAVDLFVDRARRVQPALPDPGEDPRAAASVRAICAACDSLPLAIELAAARTASLALADIEAGMADRPAFPGGLPGRPDRHRSLEACVAWSVDALDEQARSALACLSSVGGWVTLETAAAVAGADPAVVESLAEHSVLQFDPAGGRYRMPDTVRDHARRELAASGRGDAVGDRLVRWAAATSAGLREGLERAEPAALRRAERDDAALQAALAHAVRTGRMLLEAGEAVADLAFAWSLRGRCAQGRDRALGVRDRVPGVDTCRLTWAAAFLSAYAGDLEAGIPLALAAADEADRAGDPGTRARALVLVGMVGMFAAPSDAVPVLTEAADLAAVAGDTWAWVEGLQMLAYAHLLGSRTGPAEECVARAAEVLAGFDHEQLRAWDAALRAELAVRRGRLAEAVSWGRTGVARGRAVGEPVSTAGALLPAVRALTALGRDVDARLAVEELRSFAADHPGLGTDLALDLAAVLPAWWTDPVEAAAELEALRERSAELPAVCAEVTTMLAVARLTAGDPGAAGALAVEALRLGVPFGAGDLHVSAALVSAAARRDDAGSGHAAHAVLAAASALDDPLLLADALDVAAGAAADAGRPETAACLHASAGAARLRSSAVPSPVARHLRARDEPAVAGALDPAALAAAHEAGADMDLTAAVALASRARGPRARVRSGWDSLTPTERDVVALVAEGLTNAAIGSRLFVTAGTVRTHLRSVFGKLGVTGRAELAAHAARRPQTSPSGTSIPPKTSQ